MEYTNTSTTTCDCTTSDTGCGETVLDLKIQRFETDMDLSHAVVHGDEFTTVQTENGPVSSFAKVLAETSAVYQQKWEETINSMQGVVAKTFWFEKSLTWVIQHNLNTSNFSETIRSVSGQKLVAHVEVISLDELQVQFTEPEAGHISIMFFKDI